MARVGWRGRAVEEVAAEPSVGSVLAARHRWSRDTDVTGARQVIEERLEDCAGGGFLRVEGGEGGETPGFDAVAEGAEDGDEGVGFCFGGVRAGLEGFVG